MARKPRKASAPTGTQLPVLYQAPPPVPRKLRNSVDWKPIKRGFAKVFYWSIGFLTPILALIITTQLFHGLGVVTQMVWVALWIIILPFPAAPDNKTDPKTNMDYVFDGFHILTGLNFIAKFYLIVGGGGVLLIMAIIFGGPLALLYILLALAAGAGFIAFQWDLPEKVRYGSIYQIEGVKNHRSNARFLAETAAQLRIRRRVGKLDLGDPETWLLLAETGVDPFQIYPVPLMRFELPDPPLFVPKPLNVTPLPKPRARKAR